MAELFINQAEQYSTGRPTYPEELFQFIASKTPCHDLAWDVGTGSGQAARSLAGIYKNVVATDTSPKQLEFAFKLPNIRYHCTPPTMSIDELEQNIAAESSVDLVSIAAALHWFDLPNFYQQVKRVLKKPNGVIAAWSYILPEVDKNVDTLLRNMFSTAAISCFDPRTKLIIHDKYRTIDFPFQPVDGLDHTGPFSHGRKKKRQNFMPAGAGLSSVVSGVPEVGCPAVETARLGRLGRLGSDVAAPGRAKIDANPEKCQTQNTQKPIDPSNQIPQKTHKNQ